MGELETIALTIDGRKITCSPEMSILEAAVENGINIPNLCHHPDLKPFGACRMCLVEDEQTGRLVASCVTPVGGDMVIQTANDRITRHRRNIARLMIAEHPESCIVCSKGNRCRLRWIAAQLGVGESDLYPMPNYKPFEEANPFIIRDLSKCILCGKCIRADHELVVVGAIDYNLRGFGSRPATVHELGLEQSNCTFCGTCVSLCPTAALSAKNTQYVGTPEREANSVCGFCSVGCSLSMGVSDNRIIDVNPAHHPESINGATLCVRGHFANDFLNSPDRLINPMVRKADSNGDNGWVPVSWDDALDIAVKRLIDTKKKNGPQSIAFLGSSKCSNEENYLFQKIARVLIGTNHVDNGSYIFGQPLMKVLDEKTDGGYRGNRLADLEKAEVILLLGTDPNHSVPVAGYYLKRAARQGVPLIVVDPRKTELAAFAAIWLAIKPSTDLELINGLAALLYEEKAYDSAFVDRVAEGFSLFADGLPSVDIDHFSRLTNLDAAAIKKTVALLKGKKIAMVIGQGIFQQKHGLHTLDAILNLSLMTGSLGVAGAGIYLAVKENNQMGAADMGTVPDLLPGRQSLCDDGVRKHWDKKWKTAISPDPGLNMVKMIEAAESGSLKALYIMGENPLRALPETDRVKNALKKIDFVMVQDILKTETAKIADLVLPGAAFSEKEGSVTSLEGRIQSVSAVVPPPGKAKPDWEILDLLAARLGGGKTYGTIQKVRSEIRQWVPMYAELNDDASSWIVPPGSKAPFKPKDDQERIPFCPVVSMEKEPNDKDYPFTAIIGSTRFHLGCGTRTQRSSRIKDFELAGQIEISPEDGAELGLKDHDTVSIRSESGMVKREIRIEKGLQPGHIFVPTGFNGNDAMGLFGLMDRAKPDSPGWKTIGVQMEKA